MLYVEISGYLFCVLFPSSSERKKLIQCLKLGGISKLKSFYVEKSTYKEDLKSENEIILNL